MNVQVSARLCVCLSFMFNDSVVPVSLCEISFKPTNSCMFFAFAALTCKDNGDDDEIEYLFVDVRKIQKEVVTLWRFPCQYCPIDNNYDGTMCCVSLSTLFTSTFPSFLPVTSDTGLRLTTLYIVRIIDFVNHLNIYLAYLENKVTF